MDTTCLPTLDASEPIARCMTELQNYWKYVCNNNTTTRAVMQVQNFRYFQFVILITVIFVIQALSSSIFQWNNIPNINAHKRSCLHIRRLPGTPKTPVDVAS